MLMKGEDMDFDDIRINLCKEEIEEFQQIENHLTWVIKLMREHLQPISTKQIDNNVHMVRIKNIYWFIIFKGNKYIVKKVNHEENYQIPYISDGGWNNSPEEIAQQIANKLNIEVHIPTASTDKAI